MGVPADSNSKSAVSIVDRRLALMIVVTLGALLVLSPPQQRLVSIMWLEDVEIVKDYISKNVDTEYPYIRLYEIQRHPGEGTIIEPWLGPTDGSYFRTFFIYKYDRSEVPPEENWRIDGWVTLSGKIRIFNHCRSNIAYY